MKIFSLLFLTLLMGRGCEQQKLAETAIIEYTAQSRGFYEQIIIKNQNAQVTSQRDGAVQTVKISDSDWVKLIGLVGKTDVEKMETLQAPTEKRFYDGAAIANLAITINDIKHHSTEFDHGHPPAEIADLVNMILKYSNTKQ